MNISKIIKQGEGETVEFKLGFNHEAIIAIASMANRNGGTLIVGVSDKGEVKGVQLGKETLKNWVNEIAQATDPKLMVDLRAEKVKNMSVVVFSVSSPEVKPIAVSGRYYLRIANSTRQLSLHKVNEIYMSSVGLSWDKTIIKSASVKDINLQKVKNYMQKSSISKRRRFRDPPMQTLKNLEYVKENKPTVAGILLFGTNPNKFVKHARVHCGRIKGGSIIIDDNIIDGDLFEQIDKTMSVIQRNISVEFVITGKKAQRDEIWEYPLDALREAVINAICHRDYMDSNDIIIKIYEDCISIWNPGGLPPDMPFAIFSNPNHPSKPRNKGIAQALYDVADIEQYGSGVKRILEACKASGLPTPIFEEQAGGFHVLFRKTETQNVDHNTGLVILNARQNKAIEYIKKHNHITNSGYQKFFKVSKSTATRELNILLKQGVLERQGSVGTGTIYLLKK